MKRKRPLSTTKINDNKNKMFLDISTTIIKKEEEKTFFDELTDDIIGYLIKFLTIDDYINLSKIYKQFPRINQSIHLNKFNQDQLNSIELSIVLSELGFSIEKYCGSMTSRQFYFNKKIKSIFNTIMKDITIEITENFLIKDIINPNHQITNQDMIDIIEIIKYIKNYEKNYTNDNCRIGFIPTYDINNTHKFLEYNNIKYRELFYVPTELNKITAGQTFEKFCNNDGLPYDFKKMEPISNQNIKIENVNINFFEFIDPNQSLFQFIQKTDAEKIQLMKLPSLSTYIRNIYAMIEIDNNKSYCKCYDLLPEILSKFIIIQDFKQINGKKFTKIQQDKIEERKKQLEIFEKDYKLNMDKKIFNIFNKFCTNK